MNTPVQICRLSGSPTLAMFSKVTEIKGAQKMPVPAAITNQGSNLVHVRQITSLPFAAPNPGNGGMARQITKTVECYIELDFQAKHSANVRSHCSSNNLNQRNSNGTQVNDGSSFNNSIAQNGFYYQRSQTVSEIVIEHIQKEWKKSNHIANIDRKDCCVQSKVQNDGFRYEVSYYYDNEIYAFFHCYP